ncbi:TPR-like protein [Jaminaea rosea]|uniref:TPR-like protein n=1 Tax=Jaminaea rosea TaxID=1569628 RepID=A0A316UZJ0_9BASI|nr:TPR-like protein [Jaminaea rosea]PWN29721.1 TPR-like protein [Jaminaea rosea]
MEVETERILSIPTEQGDVPIDLADLPNDAESVQDIVGLLAADAQPAHYWATLAYEYLRHHDNEPAAIEFLGRGSHTLRMTPNKSRGTALLDSMLAGLYANRARSSPKQIIQEAKYQPLAGREGLHAKHAHFSYATQLTNAAAASDPAAVHSQLSRAVDMALKGMTNDAERIFTDVSTKQPKNTLALLGKACCLLRRRAFPQALAIYQHALALVLPYEKKGDFSRPDPRIGIGLCLAGMGKVSDARRAWQRSADIYPNKSAPKLLLGLSAINAASQSAALPLGLFDVGISATEEQARQAAREQGLASIQAAWALNNKSAMTAVALSEHFARRASALAAEGDVLKATAQFTQALKLGEHALQYADARSDLLAATAATARAAHLAMHAASQSKCTLDEMEMRSMANRHWNRIVEDLGRAPLPGSSNAAISPLFAHASVSLAQLQLGQGEVVAAMHTLDVLRLANHHQTPSHLVEASFLEASLRAASHPGAGKEEVARDRHKARVLLERSLNLCDAASEDSRGGSSSTAASRKALVAEVAGQSTVQQIHALGQDVLANVELAQLLQVGASRADLPRAARRYQAALDIFARQREAGSDVIANTSASLEIRLRANLGAILGVRALESVVGAGFVTKGGPTQPQHPLIERSLEHLRVALDLIRSSEERNAAAPEDLESEKTTILYNAARLQESSSSLEDARRTYETLLSMHPEYIDARVRLAIMVASLPSSDNVNGKATQLANAYFKEALSSDPANLDTRAAYVCFLAGELPCSPYPGQWGIIKDTLAELFLGANDSKATRVFGGAQAAKQVATDATGDSFIMSAMGWSYYQLGREARDKKERERCMFRSAEFFGQALANDQRCAVAAQGLGILLCDDGLIGSKGPASQDPEAERDARRRAVDEGLSVFSKLREVRHDGSIHVCLGHALGRREEWERSAKAYEVASRQYYDDANANVLVSWAMAEYHVGLSSRSFPTLMRSVERLSRARSIFEEKKQEIAGGAGEPATTNGSANGENGAAAAKPSSNNPRLLSLEAEIRLTHYNSAVIKQKSLQMLLETRKEERLLPELRQAIEGISDSLSTFTTLLPAAQQGQLGLVSAELLEQRIQFGESLRDRQAQAAVQEQEAFEAEVAERSEAVKALRAEKERQRVEAEQRAREEEEKRLEEVKERRRRAVEEAREFTYRLPSPEVQVKQKRGGGGEKTGKKRSRKQRGASSEVETDEEERRAQDALLEDDENLAALTGESEGEGAYDEEERQKRRADRKRAKMEELRASRAAKKQKGSKGKPRKKRVVKDSDAESSSESSSSEGGPDSDDEEEAQSSNAGSDGEDDGAKEERRAQKLEKKKRKEKREKKKSGKKSKKAAAPSRPAKRGVVDDDMIDTDEEM